MFVVAMRDSCILIVYHMDQQYWNAFWSISAMETVIPLLNYIFWYSCVDS